MPAKPVPRHPNGRANWKDPTMRRIVQGRLSKGQGVNHIARTLGLCQSQLSGFLKREGLNDIPSGWMSVQEAADIAGISRQVTTTQLLRRKFPTRRLGSALLFKSKDVDKWLEERGKLPVWSKVWPGHTTAEMLSKQWGCALKYARTVLAEGKVPVVAYMEGGSRAKVYRIEDAEKVRPPTLQVRPPKGYVQTKRMAWMAGVGHKTVIDWVGLGCPRMLCHGHVSYFDPQLVLAWLEKKENHHRVRAARRLRATLALQVIKESEHAPVPEIHRPSRPSGRTAGGRQGVPAPPRP